MAIIKWTRIQDVVYHLRIKSSSYHHLVERWKTSRSTEPNCKSCQLLANNNNFVHRGQLYPVGAGYKLSVLKKLWFLNLEYLSSECERIGRKQSFDVTTSIQIYFRYPKIKMLQCLKWKLWLPTKIMAKTWHVKQKIQRWPTENFLGRKQVSNLMCYVSKLDNLSIFTNFLERNYCFYLLTL